MEKLGVTSENISVVGITLKPFTPADTEVVKQKLRLTDKDVVLMSSGSLGIGFPEQLLLDYATQLQIKLPNVQLVVVCGKNETMKHHLIEEAGKKDLHNMTVLGFYEPMSELYAITKVFLTKPGGLTIAEALRDNVQMITTHFLPGQEELNYKYLTKHNLMSFIPDPMTAKNLVAETEKSMEQKKVIESPVSVQITQKNNEGTEIIKSIKKLFHIV